MKWLTTKQISKMLNISRPAVYKRAKKEGWEEKIEVVKGNIKIKYYFVPSNQKPSNPSNQEPSNPSNPSNQKADYPLQSHSQDKLAKAKGLLCRNIIKYMNSAKRKGKKKTSAFTEYVNAYNTSNLDENIYNIVGKIKESTVRHWIKIYRDSGNDYTSLILKYNKSKKGRKVPEQVKKQLLKFYLHQNSISIGTCINLVKYKFKKEQIEIKCSDATMRRFLEDYTNEHKDIVTLLREGESVLTNKMIKYVQRDPSVLNVGDVLIADGHRLNFDIINPITGKQTRMVFIVFLDWASRYPAGGSIMLQENTQAISNALRNAIINLGKYPKSVYLDNGKAFKSKFFTREIDLEWELGGLYCRLGIDECFAMPYNARAKTVERFFGTFNESFERLMPSYRGRSIEDKPPYLLRNEKWIKKIYERKPLQLHEAMLLIQGWMDYYVNKPHRGLKGKTPREIWEAGKGPGVNEEELYYLMLADENRVIRRNGIEFLGINYYHKNMYGRQGEQVDIRYDFNDLGWILVYDKEKQLICKAHAIKSIHPMIKISESKELDIERLKRNIREQAWLKKQTKYLAKKELEMLGDVDPIDNMLIGQENSNILLEYHKNKDDDIYVKIDKRIKQHMESFRYEESEEEKENKAKAKRLRELEDQLGLG